MNFSRRRFITRSVAGAAALASIPAIVTNAIGSTTVAGKSKYSLFEKGKYGPFPG